ncbi:MAG: hypothetical protein AAFR93_03395 [Pseudomonadota bacterium]
MADKQKGPRGARDGDALDALFAQARSAAPRASAALHARVLDEAGRVAQAQASRPEPSAFLRALGMLERSLSGWRAGIALAACACLGVWLGYGDPVGLQTGQTGLVTALEADAFVLDPDAPAFAMLLLDG